MPKAKPKAEDRQPEQGRLKVQKVAALAVPSESPEQRAGVADAPPAESASRLVAHAPPAEVEAAAAGRPEALAATADPAGAVGPAGSSPGRGVPAAVAKPASAVSADNDVKLAMTYRVKYRRGAPVRLPPQMLGFHIGTASE